MKRVKLGDVLEYEQPTDYIVESTDYKDTYPIPVLTAGKSFILGYTNETKGVFNNKLPVIIFDDFTTATKYVDFPFKVKSSAIKILIAKKDQADIKFLYYLIQRIGFDSTLHKRYWISTFSKIEIILPPLAEQQRIVSLLDKSDSLRQKRRQSLALMDEFLKSTFLDMFGGPNDIITKHPVLKLVDISTKINDGEHGTVARTDEGFLYLMARNITHDNNIDLTEVSYISKETHNKIYRRCNPEQDDLLLVCVGATIGKCVLVPKMEQFSIARSVALIKPHKNYIKSRYLLHLFKTEYIKRQLNLGSNESAQAGLYIGKIKDIQIPVPPINNQNKFAFIVEKTEQAKEKMKAQLTEMDNNFNGLMAEVFKSN